MVLNFFLLYHNLYPVGNRRRGLTAGEHSVEISVLKDNSEMHCKNTEAGEIRIKTIRREIERARIRTIIAVKARL